MPLKGVMPKNAAVGLSRTGKGRPPGATNLINRDIKEMMLQALNNRGGVAYLERQAEKNPNAFIGLLGKIMPTQITGADGGPVMVITGVVRADDVPTIEHGITTIQSITIEPALPVLSTTPVPPIPARRPLPSAPEPPQPPPEPPAPEPQRAPYMPPPRPHPLPEVPAPAVPANQLLGARTAETESGMRVRSLLAPWS